MLEPSNHPALWALITYLIVGWFVGEFILFKVETRRVISQPEDYKWDFLLCAFIAVTWPAWILLVALKRLYNVFISSV